MSILNLIIFSGILSIIYGFWAGNSVLKSNPGSEKMQEISSAIQIGAQAYLNRQYTTIAIVGAVICVLLYLFFRDFWVVGGFLIGAILSGAAGYIGMIISGAGAVFLSNYLAWSWVYNCMAGCILIGMITVLSCNTLSNRP